MDLHYEVFNGSTQIPNTVKIGIVGESIISCLRKTKSDHILRNADWSEWCHFEIVNNSIRIHVYHSDTVALMKRVILFAKQRWNTKGFFLANKYWEKATIKGYELDEKGIKIISTPWNTKTTNLWRNNETAALMDFEDGKRCDNLDTVFKTNVCQLYGDRSLKWYKRLHDVESMGITLTSLSYLEHDKIEYYRADHIYFFAYTMIDDVHLDLGILFFITDTRTCYIKYITRYMQSLKVRLEEVNDITEDVELPHVDDLFCSVLQFCKEEFAITHVSLEHVTKGSSDLIKRNLKQQYFRKNPAPVPEQGAHDYGVDNFRLCSNLNCVFIATHQWAHTNEYVFCGEECAKTVFITTADLSM